MLSRVTRSDLSICPSCDRDFVEPLAVHGLVDGRFYLLTLRCPNCDWAEEGAYPEKAVEALDEALDCNALILLQAHERLLRDNLEGEIERFTAALACDAIVADDF